MSKNTVNNPVIILDKATGTKNRYSASEVNSYRIMAVIERLYVHINSRDKYDYVEFFNLCLSLARGIDYSIANSEVPNCGRELPVLLKQVCTCKSDCLLHAAIMVLMISAKNACENGWFSRRDSEDLKTLAYEIGSDFCSAKDISTEASSLAPTISTLMSRFYPHIKIDQMLAFLTAKPGFEAYVMDFQILKNGSSSPEDKIYLLVAQLDNMETSACIISPQQVNFLLNGKGVERRNNIFMDNGPQLPTDVTKLLKYGTNLLQAVGQFNGNYAIIIAYMSVGATPVRPSLQDHIQPTVALLDTDTELIEGPSRISLNCPISMQRIKTPVKGQSCNHHQCFDLDNYVDINSRRPSWRCPHCNQSICFIDIRIDQKMVEILKEVGKDVADVMIFADGSWKAATESNDQRGKQHHKTSNCIPDDLPQQEPVCTENGQPDIMDLTNGDDEMNTVGEKECMNHNTGAIYHNIPDIEDNGISGSAPTNNLLSPVLTDAVSLALHQEPDGFHAPPALTSVPPSKVTAPVNTQVQQNCNSDMINEYGRFPSASNNINRVPVAVQALPAQPPVSLQRPSNTSHISPKPVTVNGSGPVFSNVERQQQARSHLNALQGSYLSPSLQQQIGSWGPQGRLSSSNRPSQQNYTPQAPSQHPGAYRASAGPNISGQNLHQQQFTGQSRPSQQINTPSTPSQHPGAYRASTGPTISSQSLNQQQSTGQRYSHIRSQSPGMGRSFSHLPPTQTHQGVMLHRVPSGPFVGQQQEPFRSSAPRARTQTQPYSVQMKTSSIPSNVDTNRPLTTNTEGTVQPLTRPEGIVSPSAADQDWRPTGRMRGSLSGQAYSDALNLYFSQPTQPVLPNRPLANAITSPSDNLSPLHVPRANSMNNNATQETTHSSMQPANTAGNFEAGQHQTE